MAENKDELKKVFLTEDEMKSAEERAAKEESAIKADSVEKEDDLRAITKEAEQLEKEFARENKEELERLKREEKEKKEQVATGADTIAKEPEKETEAEKQTENGNEEKPVDAQEPKKKSAKEIAREKTNARKANRSSVAKILQFMAIPLIVLGGVILWNSIFGHFADAPMLLVFAVVLGVYTVVLKTLIHAFKYEVRKRDIVLKCIVGTLLAACAVAVIIFREYIAAYLILALGICIAIVAFVTLILVFGKLAEKTNKKTAIFHVVLTSMVFVVGVLFAVSHFVSGEIFFIITGSVACVFGSALFSA